MSFSTMNSTLSLFLFCFFCCCFCFCFHGRIYTAANNNYTSNSPLSEYKCLFNLKAHDNYFKNIEKGNILEIGEGVRGSRRLLLGGLGSSPPRCTSKCGGCMPCKPVHVAVPPGTLFTTEYYPEAWRCKCGNKFYMP